MLAVSHYVNLLVHGLLLIVLPVTSIRRAMDKRTPLKWTISTIVLNISVLFFCCRTYAAPLYFLPYFTGLIAVSQIIHRVRIADQSASYHSVSKALKMESIATTLVAALGLATMVKEFALSSYDGTGLNIACPINGEDVVVYKGGFTSILNHHTGVEEQRYALDVGLKTSLNDLFSIYKNNYQGVRSYGQPIYSPCRGEIVAIENDQSDTTSVSVNTSKACGNQVTLRCLAMNQNSPESVVLVLCHLKGESVLVEVGQNVDLGDEIAQIGMTGFSSVPHLHIHAYREDKGRNQPVPVLFNARFLRYGDEF